MVFTIINLLFYSKSLSICVYQFSLIYLQTWYVHLESLLVLLLNANSFVYLFDVFGTTLELFGKVKKLMEKNELRRGVFFMRRYFSSMNKHFPMRFR